MTHDKATEGHTEAAAVNQAIADVRENVKRIRDNVGFALAEKNIPREPTWTLLTPQALDNIDAALRVLADAVEEGRAERDRLARQVADLEPIVRRVAGMYDGEWPDNTPHNRDALAKFVADARAVIAAAKEGA